MKQLMPLLLVTTGLALAEEPALSELKQEVARIENELGKPLAEWNAKYEAQLNKLEQKASAAGELNRVVAVRKERENYAGESAVDDGYPELKRARSIWEKNSAQLKQVQAAKSLTLWKGYRGKLKKIEKALTREQKIEAALSAQAEGKAAETRISALTEELALSAPTGSTKKPGGRPPPGPAVTVGNLVAFGTWNNGNEVNVPRDLRGFTAVAAEGTRWLALHREGTLKMGDAGGVYAEDHTKASRRLKDVTAIATGNNTNLALHRDGTVSVWGRSTSTRLAPKSIENAVAIAAGTFSNLVLHRDGTVTAWGHYMNSQPEYPAPEHLVDVVRFAAGENRIWIEKTDGEILFSHSGGSEAQEPEDRISRVKAMASGVRSGCLFLTERGKVIQWGGFESTNKLPRAKAVRVGGNLYALQREDNTWMIWGPQILAGKLQAELDRLGPLKDLALASNGPENGYFLGIQ